MHKRVSLFLLLLAAIAFSVWASDPWKDKPFTEWTMDEVRRILSDSPWARSAKVDAPWIKGEPHFLYGVPPSCSGRPDWENPSQRPSVLGPMTQSIVVFQVNWESARTMREARIRLAVLCKELDPEDAEEELDREISGYVMTVSAPDMRPFDGLEEDAIAANTYLLLKKSKRKIAPSRVIVGRGMDRQTVFTLTFEFPRTTESGEATISDDEKDVEFVTGAGKVAVKTKFSVSKMVSRNGTDL